MNRRGFLNQVWKDSIKPILIITIVVCIGAIILNYDAPKPSNFIDTSSSGGGINWQAIGELFISGIKNHWVIIVIIFSPFLFFAILLKIVPARYRSSLKKISRMVANVLCVGFIIWIGYKFYQKKEFGKMIFFAVILAISLVRSYLRGKDKTRAAKES